MLQLLCLNIYVMIIYFKFSDEENKHRKKRRCKINTKNRIIHFMHTMGDAPKLFNIAFHYK